MTGCGWLVSGSSRFVPITSITQEFYGHFPELQQARQETDRDIMTWAHSLATSPPPERLHYVSLAHSTPRDVDFARAIVHFFNRQTHHRGQITAALSRLGVDFGVTDLIFMPEEDG